MLLAIFRFCDACDLYVFGSFCNVAGLDFATVENLLNFDYFCDVLRLLCFFLTILLDFKFCLDFNNFMVLL